MGIKVSILTKHRATLKVLASIIKKGKKNV